MTNFKFSLKCCDRYFSGFEDSEKNGQLVPSFVDNIIEQIELFDSLLEAKEVCKACRSKYCAYSGCVWTIVVVNTIGYRKTEAGTIWSSVDV